MEKTYRHRKTGELAYYKDGVFKQGNCSVEIGVEPSSEFWAELTYEILSFKHTTCGDISSKRSNGLFLNSSCKGAEGKYTEDYHGLSSWKINSVKRLSDNVIFTVKDKIKYKLADREAKIIVGITLRNDSIWLETDSVKPTYGMDLEYAEKVKEPILTTEDNVDIFEGDDYYYLVKKDLCYHYVSSADKKFDSKKEGLLDFKYKENAEEYRLMNKPLLSLNDILSVWGSGAEAFKESPLFKNFKDLAKTKL
jgi:hypothetical protein